MTTSPAQQPATEQELAATIADAASRREPVAVAGGGTQAGLGRPVQAAATLSAAGLTGVTLYEPAEQVIAAWAGTPLAEVESVLATENQRLAFEPTDRRRLYASEGTPTIGAVVATNASGPRRIQAGAARDSLIGIRAVNGSGEVIKSGGRVMKNVTGYDLAKFLAGSHGTLAVLSEVTFKIQPIPETEATLVINGLDDAAAVAALSAALGSTATVTGAAHRPAGNSDARTWVRIEGFAASVKERTDHLTGVLSAFGVDATLDPAESQACWEAVGDLSTLTASVDSVVWKVSVKPSDGPAVAAAVSEQLDCQVLYDWGGGLVWIALPDAGTDGGAGVVRGALNGRNGHATLVRAPDAIRTTVDVFEPSANAIADLTRKMKATFDPGGILNPGRMYAGV
ncbi:FAD-binding protein [Bauldia sp.]|uniref:FAD-binding protein n=1 Tax=Bauldia sp. TaxID=2575872 RepID=UPI003BA97FD0